MRIEIRTNGTVKDNDIKALYLIEEAMKISTPRMRKANLDFIKSKWNFNHQDNDKPNI